MRARMVVLVIVGVVMFTLAGCAAFMVVNERAMTVDDVISLSKAKLGSDVIIRQIEVTRSKFRLTPTDLVRLKNEGVDDDVIESMIETETIPEGYGWGYGFGYTPYDYWYNQYYPYYNYPIYDYYYNPFSMYQYWGRPYNNYWRSPYTVRRTPGMVGRYYEYYPAEPLPGREPAYRDYFKGRRDDLRRPDRTGREPAEDDEDK